MLTWEEDVEVTALHHRGWTISAIARHLGRSRTTIRAYVRGDRQPGERRRSAPDPLAPYLAYVTERLREDPHVWATALWDEVRRLGYAGAYSSFTEAIRHRQLRPHCEACCRGPGPADDRDQSSRRRGDPVGLPGAAGSLGWPGPPAGRLPGPQRQDARGLLRQRGSAGARRRHRPGAAPAGRHGPALALRPDLGCLLAGHRRRAGQLRGGGQALWGGRRHLPAAAGQSQGGGGESQPLRRPAVVADGRGARRGRRPARLRQVLRRDRRRAGARGGHRARGRGRGSRCGHCRSSPTRRPWR